MFHPKCNLLLFLSILSIREIVQLSDSFSPAILYYHSCIHTTTSTCCYRLPSSAHFHRRRRLDHNDIIYTGSGVLIPSPIAETGTVPRCVSQSTIPENTNNHPNLPPLAEQNIDDSSSSTFLTIIPGKHKWLGGAVDLEGRIYGIPSNAKDIICLVPSSLLSLEEGKKMENHPPTNDGDLDPAIGNDYTVHMIPLPSRIANGSFKWLRGIICGDYLYGIPAWSQQGVLRVDIASYWRDQAAATTTTNHGGGSVGLDEEYVTTIPLPEVALESSNTSQPFLTNEEKDGLHQEHATSSSSNTASSNTSPSRWLWHGAALNQNRTAIYAIPSNARHVLKVDLQTQTTSLLSIPTTVTALEQTNKWYGGILGDDNAIYGVPYAASDVLRIDANHDTVEVIGEDMFGIKEYNWHGGIKSGKNGKIYCFPAHHSQVLCIDTRWNMNNKNHEYSKRPEERLELLPIHRAYYDKDEVTKYKWLGGSIGADGNIYGMPSDASSILRIDTDTNIATTFGRVGREKNKYQGGTLAGDGVIYAIPSNANDILCVDTNQVTNNNKNNEWNDGIDYLAEDAAFTIGDIYGLTQTKRKDKWQGGFLGKDGSVYCIPENFNRILKLIPQKKDSRISFL